MVDLLAHMQVSVLGQKIKEIREAEGKSQQWLANELKLDESTIVRYENGHIKDPTLSTLAKLCNVFNIGPDYFLTERPLTLQRRLEENEDVLSLFARLPKSSIQHFRKLILLELAEYKVLKLRQPLKKKYPVKVF